MPKVTKPSLSDLLNSSYFLMKFKRVMPESKSYVLWNQMEPTMIMGNEQSITMNMMINMHILLLYSKIRLPCSRIIFNLYLNSVNQAIQTQPIHPLKVVVYTVINATFINEELHPSKVFSSTVCELSPHRVQISLFKEKNIIHWQAYSMAVTYVNKYIRGKMSDVNFFYQ